MRRAAALAGPLALLAAAAGATLPALAAEERSFAITMNDGAVTPTRLDVPANARFRIELTNAGKTPAEFESAELHLEKVVAAGSKATLVVRSLDPGEHTFFDDFHPDAPKVVLSAK